MPDTTESPLERYIRLGRAGTEAPDGVDRLDRIRVYREDYGDGEPWTVDAVDSRTGLYSEEIERFATHHQAITHGVPALIADLREGGRWP